mmetsp:Transcript_18852/g.47363  ORF Transcript_18852/g.47363 Transcript_18852/m.47363 type:complete len:213 (-) Transcript_18852:2644-3282(-)
MSTSGVPQVMSSSSVWVKSASSRTGRSELRPRSTACVCVLPSLSRALRTAAQYAARLCQVTSMCAPPSTTSASVPFESTVVNDSKIKSAKSSSSTPSSSMCSILCREEHTASSKPARSAPSAGCCTSCFQKTEQSESEMTVSFCSSAIAMKTPIISYHCSSSALVLAGCMMNRSRLEPRPCWPLGVGMSSGSTASFSSSEHSMVNTSRYGPP